LPAVIHPASLAPWFTSLNNNEQIIISCYSYLRPLDKNGIFPIVEPLLVTDLMESGSVSY